MAPIGIHAIDSYKTNGRELGSVVGQEHRVTALVLNYEYEAETKRLANDLADRPVRPVIVDNSNSDALEAWAEERDVAYLRMEGNVGYGVGNNHGMEAFLTETEYFLVLNPDVRLPEGGVLDELVASLDEHPEIGVLCPLIRTEKGNVLPNTSRLWRLARRLDLLPDLPPPRGDVRFCDFAQGAAMLIRAEVREDLGGFHDAFFLYGEEVEYSVRVRQHGWAVAVHTGVEVEHTNPIQEVTENEAYKTYYDTRNRFLLGTLRFAGASRLVYTVLAVASVVNHAVTYLRVGDAAMLRPLLLGVWDALNGRYGRYRYLTG